MFMPTFWRRSKILSLQCPTLFTRAPITIPWKRLSSRSYNMEKSEEEALSNYDSANYYPVQLNETLGDSYTVKVKLGFGRTATTWLCIDSKGAYKVLKVGRVDALRREKMTLEKLGSTASFSEKPGHACVRQPECIFDLIYQEHSYNCFVFAPLGPNLLEFKRQLPEQSFGIKKAQIAAAYMLFALDAVHSAGIIHADMKLDNLQITIPDPETRYLDAFCAADNALSSVSRRNDSDTPIVSSREMKQAEFTNVILCDLGSAVDVTKGYHAVVQALPYRAPEVILGAEWDQKIDMWSLGVLVWELIFDERLFGNVNDLTSLELMIRYLGPPPRSFLDRCKGSNTFFDEQGNWKHGEIERVELKDRVESEDGSISDLLDFLRCALEWDPSKRSTATQLLDHAWLRDFTHT